MWVTAGPAARAPAHGDRRRSDRRRHDRRHDRIRDRRGGRHRLHRVPRKCSTLVFLHPPSCIPFCGGGGGGGTRGGVVRGMISRHKFLLLYLVYTDLQ